MSESQETWWESIQRDFQAGIVPEKLVWVLFRVPMAILFALFLGAVCYSLVGFSRSGSQTAEDYQRAIRIEGPSQEVNARQQHAGTYLRQEDGMGRIRNRHGGETKVKIKHLVYCRSAQTGREYFGNFSAGSVASLQPQQPVQFEVFDGVITELSSNGQLVRAVDHPLSYRSSIGLKTGFFILITLVALVTGCRLILFSPRT